ncbi:MAG: signal peptide peptidase SppA [Bacteroidales bacterium]|nr:signal peptide peptidase SppA [Bacteroidales bacterium]
MKFWKTTLAVVVGIFIASILSVVLSLMFFGALGSEKTPTMPSECVLDLDMSKISLCEQTSEMPAFVSMIRDSDLPKEVSIYDAVCAIEKAAADPAIKYIYLRPDGVSAGMAGLEEFRIALSKAREAGKPIIAYTENPSNGSYYLPSVADKVYMTSCRGGMSSLLGLGTRLTFLKDLLDAVGVKVQLIRHGKYKSAGETFIRNTISEENRLQYKELLGSIWGTWCDQMASSRGMSAEKLNSIIDNLELNFPADYLEKGLVDSLVTLDGLQAKLASLYGVESIKDVKSVSLSKYAKIKVVPNYRAKDKIAILYAEGEIVDGKGQNGQLGGDSFSKVVADVRRDSTVKAVVFRVNSPGGSVIASEKIKNEIDLLKAEKPVIASYGDYAASGGYWISNGCTRIFSDASTLTGSIGVFSMIPDISGVYGKVHVGTASISTNKHSDMYSLMRPLDKDELAYMQASVEDIYEAFTALVAEGRGLTRDYVDEIAQGRVWSGTDGVRIGIVDQVGTLTDALEYAATVANGENGSDLSGWQIVSYPETPSAMEEIMSMFGREDKDELYGTVFEPVVKAFKAVKLDNCGKVFARMTEIPEIR